MSPRFLVAVTLALLGGGQVLAVPAPADALRDGFRQPPREVRPQTWWHWMNGNVSREGITLDLEAMRRVGLGGVQLFQVGADYLPAGPAAYGTPANLELVRFAIKEADRLGLELTLHNCPGWSSSGGPWIPPELAMKNLAFGETNVDGGRHLSLDLAKPPTERPEFRDLRVCAFPTTATSATPIDPATIVDLTAKMDGRGHLEWDAPAGQWSILRIGVTVRDQVNRAAPSGGEGLECDKYSREAIDYHFKHFFGPLMDVLEPLARQGRAGALIDSYEVGRQDWTESLPEEFRQRAGYDLGPWLPAMARRVLVSPEMTERFLWDLRRVQADLVKENYFGLFAELCHEHGLKFAVEPYGKSNFDEMAAGAAADVPMGEFWQDGSTGGAQRTVKLAASIAHLNGSTVVGAESFTARNSRWAEFPHALKALGDEMFSVGLNQLVFHRFAMQPHPTAVPGMTMGPWGGFFDRTNTWFDAGAAWIDYLGRAQFLLRQGEFVGDVLYFTGEDSPVATTDRSRLRPEMPNGFDYDTIGRATILGPAALADGRVRFGKGSTYRVLVLPPMRSVSIELLRRLHTLAQQGLTLVVTGNAPLTAAGLDGYPSCDDEVRRLGAELWGDLDGATRLERAFGAGHVFRGLPLADVLARLELKPDFEARRTPASTGLGVIHRRVGETEIYFLSNNENRPMELMGLFNVRDKTPELWDAVSGGRAEAPVWRAESDGRTSVALQLPAAGSIFVVFRAPATPDHWTRVVRNQGIALDLDVMWKPVISRPSSFPDGEGPAQALLPMPEGGIPFPVDFDFAGAARLLVWENGHYVMPRAAGGEQRLEITDLPAPRELVGPWHLAFQPGRGAPESIELRQLRSLSLSPLEGVRFFSGTVAYTHRFTLDAGTLRAGRRYFIDLGKVQVIAQVRLNGRELGSLWTAPFRLDATAALREGHNELEVRVTNLWVNRLIGDELLPAENDYVLNSAGRGPIRALPAWFAEGKPKPAGGRTTFETWKHFDAGDALPASGLIGPVVLREAIVLNTHSQIP